MLITLIVGSLAAYSFSRIGFRGSSQLYITYLATRTLPGITYIIPLFILAKMLGLVDTLTGQIIITAAISLPFDIMILNEYFKTIPQDLLDAAKIDGLSMIGILLRIIWPLAKPGLAATAAWSFMSSWNMFLVQIIIAMTEKSMQAPVIAGMFVTDIDIDYGMLNTCGILSALPPLIIAFIFQKYIISGIIAGAVKG